MGIDMGDGRIDGDGPYVKAAGNGPDAIGTVYIVTGSAGSSGPIDGIHPVMYETTDEKGSMYMEVTGNQMDIKFVQEEGIIWDYLTIMKQAVVGEAPTISITSPANGTNYGMPQNVIISADAADSDGTITQVEFRVNGISAGIDDQSPYSISHPISNNGTYTITAVATDNDGNNVQASSEFTVGPVNVCSIIDASSDDAEQRSSGTVKLNSGDIELVDDPGQGNQLIGLRFNGLNIPPGVIISDAYLQFTVDEAVNDNPCNLTISGEASANPVTFSTANNDVGSRPRTNASVSWTPADWLAVGDAGADQQSPDITAIIQEIIDQPNYSASSSIALFIEGVGRRTAEGFDGKPGSAPQLCLQYSQPLPDCPDIPGDIGATCDDGDNTTINDTIDANCNCVGTPTACTGIGDADGDGICADIDCDDNDPNITTQVGDACDDGNPATINDVLDANCNCTGTLNDCPDIGDADGDGICSDVDCDDNNPTTLLPGLPCDDGDNTTINDIVDANCNCAGTPTACTGIGDADGDGVCADVDCDDNDPNNTSQPGDLCNDGDPTTINEYILSDCSCGGGSPAPAFTCVRVSSGSDDAEERSSGSVSTTSSDLELVQDPGQGIQSVGMRFTGLDIPQGAAITSAYLQFTADESNNVNPCDLTIYGEASDNAATFAGAANGITARQYTSASVSWSPADWLAVGDAGAAQQTPDIATLIQEIVNRPGYTASSALVFIIEGTGARTADAFEGGAGLAPQLCVGFTAVQYDCLSLLANIGDPCDDGDNTTLNDAVDANCNCAGTPTACTGIGDADGDGVCADTDCNDNDSNVTTADADGDGICADVDCDDNDANITTQQGSLCDDGDNTTIDDTIDANCNCTGTPTACTGIGDADGDGVCADIDCDDNDAGITTVDADGDGLCSDVDCNDNDANINYQAGDSCDDGDNTTIDDTIDANCNCVGTPTDCTGSGDADGDGICADVDCDDNDVNNTNQPGNACDDGDNTTINDVIDANCNCTGTPTACTGIGDADGDGVCADVDCDDNDANNTNQPGSACDDGDNTTIDDTIDANCNCTGTPTACTGIGDSDGDGVCADVDCDDNDANNTNQPGNACDDGDNTTINDTVDANCNCAGTPTACTGIGDADGDGVCADVDCDDNNAGITTVDADGDGLCADVDCDDNNPNINYQPGDACDDGDPNTFGETIQSDCSCGGGTADPTTTCASIDSSSDDAEQRGSGTVNTTSGDIELIDDPGQGTQVVGLKFNGLNIPQGATIVNAYIQFIADETTSGIDPCNLEIYGQASDNAATFTNTNSDITNRPTTNTSVIWSPPLWQNVGDAGPDQQTPDLSAVVQEIVSRAGYTSGSSIAFIIQGTGRRTAEAFDSGVGPPQLCVDYFDDPPVYDCPAISAYFGDPCDDGDNTTINDTVDNDCNCMGTPTACTGIGDVDGDGICADVDCDDNNASITTQPGDACDDGNAATINDMIDANCNCAGTINDCPDIGDADGDGICADVDCNDNDASITTQVGDACDDGNPATNGETIQADCSCGGGSTTPTTVCLSIDGSGDDVEERISNGVVDLTSSDLELGLDRGNSQIVGLRYNNLSIPQGANIVSAYIQFTVDETGNDDPCDLTIYAEAADDAAAFVATNFDVSSRARTSASISWSPAQWLAVGDAGPDQQTVDIAPLIQEVVNRSGYTSGSSIALFIEGSGRRVAESADGPSVAPQLCIDFFGTPPSYDCPSLSAFIGDACDDGDNTTVNDMVDGDCNCIGTPTACTGIGDADGDGICADVDCDDNDASITTQPGSACDDGNPATINDALDANCNCAGTLNDCQGSGDADGDGICSDVDCNDNDANITSQEGDACDDGDPNTVGETIQADCSCGGGVSTPTQTCSMVNASSDDAEERASNTRVSITSSDLELCADRGNAQYIGMRFNGLNIPQGAVITSAYLQFTVDENINEDPCDLNIYGEASDNAITFAAVNGDISSRPTTNASVAWSPPSWLTVGNAGAAQQTPDLSAVIQEIVDRGGYSSTSSIVLIIDGTGRRAAESYNGSITGAPELCVEYLYASNANAIAPGNNGEINMEAISGGITTDEPIGPIHVYPNPARERLNISFNCTLESMARIIVRDLNGRVVLEDKQEISKGPNLIQLEGLTLPSGTYFLQLYTDDSTQLAKFLIYRD